MSLKLGTINNSRPRSFQGGGNGGGAENVAVMIAEIHLADKTGKAANPAEDYAIAYLLEDGFGKKAEFKPRDPSIPNIEDDHEYNTPMTSVKVMMKERTFKGEHTPMEIYDLQVGKRKGVGAKMGEFPTVILENAWLENRSDTVKAGWLSIAQRSFKNLHERAITNVLLSVDKERVDERTGKGRQYRHVIEADAARTFSTMDELKATVVEMLSDNPEAVGGRPSAMVRLVHTDPANVEGGELLTSTVYPVWDSEASAYLTPEQSFDAWLSGDRIQDQKSKDFHAQFIGAVEQVGTADAAGYVFEVIPSYRYITGSQSLPSVKGKGIDDADSFRMPMVDRETGKTVVRNDGNGIMTVGGFAAGTLLVQREKEDETAPWYSTKGFRKQRFGAIFPRDEIVTPNLSEEVKAHFEARAVKRGQEMKDSVKKGNERAPAAAQDEEIPFGEPDHSGGLTPS